jgi:hypothetical protein
MAGPLMPHARIYCDHTLGLAYFVEEKHNICKRRQTDIISSTTVLPWLLGVATNADRHRARPFRRHVQFVSRLPHSDPRSGENQADHAQAVASRVDAERAVREMLDTVAVLQAKCLYESKARLLKEGEKQPVPH